MCAGIAELEGWWKYPRARRRAGSHRFLWRGCVGRGGHDCGLGIQRLRWEGRGIRLERKMSLVTAAILYSSRSFKHSASIKAVLPDPTGLAGGAKRPCQPDDRRIDYSSSRDIGSMSKRHTLLRSSFHKL